MDSSEDELLEFTASIQQVDPDRADVAIEVEALQSIYGSGCIKIWKSGQPSSGNVDEALRRSKATRMPPVFTFGEKIRFEVLTTLPSPHEDIPIKLLTTLLPTYPSNSPPQLQLLSRYVGDFGVDSEVFGLVLRAYLGQPGVEWHPGDNSIFDGIEYVRGTLGTWYQERLPSKHAKLGSQTHLPVEGVTSTRPEAPLPVERDIPDPIAQLEATLPPGVVVIEGETITDRKSVFVGRACIISDPSQVEPIIDALRADRRIARAAHPTIYAWRVEIGGVIHADNDDDGESAAGARLSHLLQILGLKNVLVIVTRYFGGIHLGPDRFKHINAAARSAVEAAGLLDDIASGSNKAPKR